MWIIEVNVVGRRFTRSVPDLHRPSFRFNTRAVHWRPSQLRHPRAA